MPLYLLSYCVMDKIALSGEKQSMCMDESLGFGYKFIKVQVYCLGCLTLAASVKPVLPTEL